MERMSLRMNRSIPTATVIPMLSVHDVVEATDWLCDAFGFEVRLRIGEDRAQLAFGDGAVILTRLSTMEAAGEDHGVIVRVEDVDAHYATAVEAGAEIIDPPETEEYGERQYVALDLNGHEWTFTQSVADADPGEWGAGDVHLELDSDESSWGFAEPGPLRDELTAAALAGTKTATASLVAELEADGDPIPRPGDRSILLDSDDRPVAVIETTEVRIRRMADVDDRFAIDEGEGYTGSADWRASHERYWNRYLDDLRTRLGDPSFTLGDETLVVAERFQIVVELDPDSPR